MQIFLWFASLKQAHPGFKTYQSQQKYYWARLNAKPETRSETRPEARGWIRSQAKFFQKISNELRFQIKSNKLKSRQTSSEQQENEIILHVDQPCGW